MGCGRHDTSPDRWRRGHAGQAPPCWREAGDQGVAASVGERGRCCERMRGRDWLCGGMSPADAMRGHVCSTIGSTVAANWQCCSGGLIRGRGGDMYAVRRGGGGQCFAKGQCAGDTESWQGGVWQRCGGNQRGLGWGSAWEASLQRGWRTGWRSHREGGDGVFTPPTTERGERPARVRVGQQGRGKWPAWWPSWWAAQRT